MTAYIIQHTQYTFPLYVGETENTRLVGYAKVWRTSAGAQRWINERGFPGQVVAVQCSTSKRNPNRLNVLGLAA